MASFSVKVVTPESTLFEGEAEAVFMRTDGGEIGFLSGHTPLVGSVVPGTVRVQAGGGAESTVEVEGGFVLMDGEQLVLVTPSGSAG
jgi:F-type H+-transporting ATPase subunit epsilon